MKLLCSLTIRGKVIGKKNAKKLATRRGRGMLVAKKEWVQFHAAAMDYFRVWRWKNQWREHYLGPVRVLWYYHPPSHVYPDWSAICETVGDLIQASKFRMDKKTGEKKMTTEGGDIIKDDKQIRHMDGSRILEIDKLNPRITIEIYQYTEEPGELIYKTPKARKVKA